MMRIAVDSEFERKNALLNLQRNRDEEDPIKACLKAKEANEIAVKEGNPVSIMTSYNLINGIHAANSKDLCMTVARKEWGFDGAIMSDWNTTVPEDGSVPWKCVAAGNDIIMPGNPDDDKNIRQAYKEGKLTEEEIRNCAGHLVSMIRRLERTDC